MKQTKYSKWDCSTVLRPNMPHVVVVVDDVLRLSGLVGLGWVGFLFVSLIIFYFIFHVELDTFQRTKLTTKKQTTNNTTMSFIINEEFVDAFSVYYV